MYIRGTNRIYTFLSKIFLRFYRVGKNVSIAPSCEIRMGAAPYISLGNNVTLAKDVWINIPREVEVPVKTRPVITLEDGVFIGRRSTISGIHKIEIGYKCLLAPGVFMTDHCHEFANSSRPIMEQGVTEGGTIIVEEGCWLGHNCAVITHRKREIRIGRNTVVGANAVVTKSFPENSILIGAPARNIA